VKYSKLVPCRLIGVMAYKFYVDFLRIVHGYDDNHRVNIPNGNDHGDVSYNNAIYSPVNLPNNFTIKTIVLNFIDNVSNNFIFKIFRAPVSGYPNSSESI